MLETLKYEFIRTPLEGPLMSLRDLFRLPGRLRNPEMCEIYQEDVRIHDVLRRALQVDSNCLDIGAHYGSVLSAITRLAPRGTHAAFEAIPAKAMFLRRKFPEVTIHSMALSSQPGTASFHINTSQSGFSGLAQHGDAGDSFEVIEVECGTLDAVVPDEPRIDFVKIDVEGAEEMVLRGAQRFLTRHQPLILFECGPSGAVALGRTPTDLYRLLTEELGYAVYLLKDHLAGDGPVDLERFESALIYPFEAFNWVARPAG